MGALVVIVRDKFADKKKPFEPLIRIDKRNNSIYNYFNIIYESCFSCHPAEDLLIRKAEQYPEEEKCTISEIKLRQ